MRFALFCHSLLSDWNHGNAHFLRGIASELVARGHDVRAYEARDAWSVRNLVFEHGTVPLHRFRDAYPDLHVERYDPTTLDVDATLDDADVVLVHEWNEPALVQRIGQARAAGGTFSLFFHDTHHRAVTAPEEMAACDLTHYDGVLAFGAVIRDLYLERGWAQRAWTWHEAADVRVFRPLPEPPDGPDGDVVWIGNWGDEERSRELLEFLIEPVHDLGIRGVVHGVRYPDHALALLREHGVEYRSWLANFDVPRVFARFRATVHVPRRPYVRSLPGIPTIRPFEAMACGIPLVSAPWADTEDLFRAGEHYLIARDGGEMRRLLRDLLNDTAMAAALAAAGRRAVLDRHTCAHRVDELLHIVAGLRPVAPSAMGTP